MAVTLTPYQELANAIIVQASADYKRACEALKTWKRDPDALGTKKECERFFQSDWFDVLSGLDGRVLMQDIRKACNE